MLRAAWLSALNDARLLVKDPVVLLMYAAMPYAELIGDAERGCIFFEEIEDVCEKAKEVLALFAYVQARIAQAKAHAAEGGFTQ